MENTQTEVTEAYQPIDFKTRTIQPDEIDLILLVLDESIRIGHNCEFSYYYMNTLNHIALQRTKYLNKTIELKKEIFKKLDQRSYSYSRILDTAKLALRHLQDTKVYNYYSAELITKFIQIDEVFGERNLKSTGVRFVEDPIKETIVVDTTEAKPVEQIIQEKEAMMLPETITGKRLKRFKAKATEQDEIRSALSELNFDDESEPTEIESLEDTDIDADEEASVDTSTLTFE